MNKSVILISAIAAIIMGTVTFTATSKWSRSKSIIKQDGLVYFSLARSVVIDFDTDLTKEFSYVESKLKEAVGPAKRFIGTSNKTGKITFPWPVGAGVVMSPFYAIGYILENVVAAIRQRPAESLGKIPQYFYGYGTIAYGLLGFWVMFFCCLVVSDKKSAIFSSLGITFAGPLVFYVFFQPTMAHVQSFAFTALFVLLWWRIWENKSKKIWLLCLLYGILVIIRYQNIMFGILPASIFLRILKDRSSYPLKKYFLTGIIAFLAPLTIQLNHYIATAGGFLDNNSLPIGDYLLIEQNPLNLMSPNFFKVLFSCQHGAFYWTPIFALSFLGLVLFAFKKKHVWILVVTFLAHVYLIGCLTGPYNWSGMGAFGMRYLTECSPILAMGLTVMMGKSNKAIYILLLITIGIAVIWNSMLILSFSFMTISQYDCVTYLEMAKGIVDLYIMF